MQVDTRYQKNVRGARIASNELTEVLWGGDSVGVGVIAMIYGVSDQWGSANVRVGGIAFGDSQIDFRTPQLITYKPMKTN